METFTIEQLNFSYPGKRKPALADINLNIRQGEFITLCGKSGCGKSTLLRQLKTVLCPHGDKTGQILFEGNPLDEMDQRSQAEKIGFVLQSPDNQIVTDKVWHELAFGLESLGFDTPTIRLRVAEMASFFGIQTWFHKSVEELSGGQKQLLNLAAIMAMQPSVLLLDEPTSQLDPIAASDFLETIQKINRELGTTILLTEHRLEDALPMSDRVVVMDGGRIIADGMPREIGTLLGESGNDMFLAMPAAMRIYARVENNLPCPVTVREGRDWLTQIARERQPDDSMIPMDLSEIISAPAVELSEVWFRYEKNLPDVVKGLSMTIHMGELYGIVGGNGTGKTTSISLISGLRKPYRGTVKLFGRAIADIPDAEKYDNLLGILPQNPQALFVKKTVELDLREMFSGSRIPLQEQKKRMARVSSLCELEHLLTMHPYDLSGGEQQRAALAKVLLKQPRILILDEPTKGLDAHFKRKFAGILKQLQHQRVTIIMVSHDIEFCARYADRCAMFFDGGIVGEDLPRHFFSGKSFYTTAANRMARMLLPQAVLAEDVILACGGIPDPEPAMEPLEPVEPLKPLEHQGEPLGLGLLGLKPSESGFLFTPLRIVVAVMGLGLCVLTMVFFGDRWTDWRDYLVQLSVLLEFGIAFASLFPGKELNVPDERLQADREKRKLSKRTIAATAMILLFIPLTIYVGIFYLNDRKYYFISMLIILETMLPFVMVFEDRKPQARELVIIAVLCAIGVAGRAAFFMLPQFKPVLAMVIVSGVCFGGEAGFLVGAVTMFVSNMLFSQGPWTPWQMFAAGLIGFLAGVLFRKGFLRKRKTSLCIFGFLAAFFLYGFLLDSASTLMWQAKPTKEMFLLSYMQGIPFNIIHGVATVVFLWIMAEPMIEKLDRIKVKYGLMDG